MACTPSRKSSQKEQWTRIRSMQIPDTTTICLADILRPGRIHVEVPVRQEDVHQLLPDDWRRLQRYASAKLSRDHDSDQVSVASGPWHPQRSSWSNSSLSNAATVSPPAHTCATAGALRRDARDARLSIDHPASQASPDSDIDQGTGFYRSGGDSPDESNNPLTPATIDVPSWLDSLHNLMTHQSLSSASHKSDSPRLIASPVVVEAGFEARGPPGTLVTIVEADETQGDVADQRQRLEAEDIRHVCGRPRTSVRELEFLEVWNDPLGNGLED